MKSLRDDPVMRRLIQRYGELELEPAEDAFERLVVAIVNQQLSTESARAIRDRLFDELDVTPGALLESSTEQLRDVGLSGRKIEYLREIARAFQNGTLEPENLACLSDEEALERLTSVRGIGSWTAKIYLMFVMGREDVFPVEDLGIRRGMEKIYGEMSRTQMKRKAEEWKPHRSLASLYLWRARRDSDLEDV